MSMRPPGGMSRPPWSAVTSSAASSGSPADDPLQQCVDAGDGGGPLRRRDAEHVRGRVDCGGVAVHQPGPATQFREQARRRRPRPSRERRTARRGRRRASARCLRTSRAGRRCSQGPPPRRARRPSAPVASARAAGSSRHTMCVSTRSVPGTLSVNPRMPCRPGATPVPSVTRLVGVVDGNGARSSSSDPARPPSTSARNGACGAARGEQAVPQPVDEHDGEAADVPDPFAEAEGVREAGDTEARHRARQHLGQRHRAACATSRSRSSGVMSASEADQRAAGRRVDRDVVRNGEDHATGGLGRRDAGR